MSRMPSVAMGVVVDLDDPENEGRVKVRFPWLDDQLESIWASIARPMAGNGRGMFFMPELEDECLVAFDQGRFDHAVVVGFTWNGADAPPNGDIDNSVRRFQSVTGHILEFNDNDGAQAIRIRSQGGHEVLLSDESGAEKISIKSNGGHTVELDDSATARIYIEDSNGSSIEMNATGVTISTPGDLSLSGTNVSIAASSSFGATAGAGGLSVDASSVGLESTGTMELSATGPLNASGNPIHLNP